MPRENIETVFYQQEQDQKIENQEAGIDLRELISYVENLLQTQETILGKGTIAEVHHLESNPRICYKIISSNAMYNTIHTTPQEPVRWYNSVDREADFMLRLQDIGGPVKVPRPYYSVVRTQEAVDDESDSVNGIDMSILAMETLNAVSVTDVIEGRAVLPAAFKHELFFRNIREFIEKMHERSVYHRDIHGGNIMIDKETGDPYLIDLGTAVYSGPEDDIYRETAIRNGKRVILPFIDDFNGISSVEGALRRFQNKLLTESVK